MMIISGNILEAEEQYIAHQCNCLTTYAKGIAKTIFDHYPHADIYSSRTFGNEPSSEQMPGNIIICGNGKDQRYVINMMGQFYPGKPKYPNSFKDGYLAREKYFKQCLKKISQIPNIKSIAFPYAIGCRLAGGDWSHYFDFIKTFAEKTNIITRIYKP